MKEAYRLSFLGKLCESGGEDNEKEKLTAILLTAALPLGLAGCSTNPDAPATKAETKAGTSASESSTASTTESEEKSDKEKIVRIGAISSPSGIFNPLYANDDWNGYVTGQIFQSLIKVDPNGNYIGNLADSWDISDDSKTVTFHLNKDAAWTDGTDFTADDVKFTLEFMVNPDYSGLNSTYITPIAGYADYHSGNADSLEGVKVIDEDTISITTEEVYASFLEKIGRNLSIIAKHIWEDVDVATADQNTEKIQNPVGTGPFILTEYVPDQYSILTKNEKYFKGTPKIDKLVIQVINADTVQAQVLDGEIDLLRVESLNPDDIEEYEDNGFIILHNRLNAYQHMVINHRNPILAKKEVRQALAYAINRQGIVDSLLYGYGEVANDVYTRDFWAYPGDDKINPYEYDPEKAKELLTDAGFTYKNGVLYDGESPVTFELIYPSGNKAREGAATVIQQNLKDIGIDVNLQLMEFAAMTAILQKFDDSYDLALLGNGFGLDADVSQLIGTNGSTNYAGFSNERVDELLSEGLNYVDVEKRAPIYKELAALTNEYLPSVYLYNWDRFTIVNPKLKNVVVSTYSYSHDIENWDIEETEDGFH